MFLASVRQCRGCSKTRRLLSPAFMCSCSTVTRNGAFPILIPRPAFLSIICGITALESHRAHLPCTLSSATRKQSRHSNASGGCSIGLNGWAISTSFRVGDTTGKLSVGFQRISIYFGALGFLRSKANPKRIHDVGELLSFTVPANRKRYE